MCLYPKTIRNKKYLANDKNGGVIPTPPVLAIDEVVGEQYDERVLFIQVPCGQCEECRKTKAREWQVRLHEELRENKKAYFVTLTFSPEELENLCKKTRLKECNAIAGYAVRHMLERWRKQYKTSLRHWLITELGHEGTERIHLHGIIFTEEQLKLTEIEPKGDGFFCHWDKWRYGICYFGNYCTAKTINYIVKYVNKIDTDHKGFIGEILCSPGIGRHWLERIESRREVYNYRPRATIDYYTLNNGCRIKLPKYYKNKLHNDEERELIWREFMDTEQQTIAGHTYTREVEPERIENIKTKARELNHFYGYGNDSKEWQKKEYNVTRRMLARIEREKAREAAKMDLKRKLEAAGVVFNEEN